MSFDPETLREYVALVGSLIAVASTLYFWLVRANRERAKLTAHAVSPLTGCVLMNEDYETQRRVNPGQGQVCAKYFLSLAVVNNSSMPNALIGAKVFLPLRSKTSPSPTWTEMDVRHLQADTPLFPINLSPLSTCSLPLAISAAIDGTLDGGFAGRAITAGEALPSPIPIRIELKGVGDQVFQVELLDNAIGMVRAQPAARAA